MVAANPAKLADFLANRAGVAPTVRTTGWPNYRPDLICSATADIERHGRRG
jgi:hypothetical protein